MASGTVDSTRLVREELLNDPAVQEAVRRAGQNALADPVVQRQIMETCKEKFPEFAITVRDKVMDWANDPEVQHQAIAYAKEAGLLASQLIGQSVGQVVGLVEQGPAGVRVLAFIGGLAACIKSVLSICGVLDPISAVTRTVFYVLHAYQAVFAVTTMMFEAKPEWIAQVPGLDEYQNMLIEKAKFLSEVLGRGLFYGFQGSLWLSFASWQALENFALGAWFTALAFLYCLMHCGIMPQQVVGKIRSIKGNGYAMLPQIDDIEYAAARALTSSVTGAYGGTAQRIEEAPAFFEQKGAAKVEPAQMTSSTAAQSSNVAGTGDPKDPVANMSTQDEPRSVAPHEKPSAPAHCEDEAAQPLLPVEVAQSFAPAVAAHQRSPESEDFKAPLPFVPVAKADKQKCCALQ